MVNAMELLRGWQDSQSERENRRTLADLAQRKFAAEQQMMPGRMEEQRLSNLAKLTQLQNYGPELERKRQAEMRNEQFKRDQLSTMERINNAKISAAEKRGGKQAAAPAGFRWTPDGNLERIPGGPADLKAEAELQKKAAGAGDVDIALGTLRDAYNRLEKGGGITSTANSGLENIPASISASGPGQAIGKMLGTNNQSARNDIAMARPALLAALMRATGMSAKQMDSNAELKLWLATATDPTLDVEANRRALDAIEKKYLGGAKLGGPTAGASGGASGGWDDAKESCYQELLIKRNGSL